MRPVWIAAMLLLLLWVLMVAPARQEGFAAVTPTIFVSVGSYRDRECLATVRDAFAKASNPRRVFVGICQQNKEAVESCTAGLDANMSQVRLMNLQHTQAKGPTYARYLCSTMWGGEDYFLQIDSHTRFAQGWDQTLIDMLARCPSRKAVLTHYPHAYDVSAEDMSSLVPVMCKGKWNSEGIPTFEAVMLPIAKAGLRRVPFCAGGMMFGHSSMLTDVPMDPTLDFLFVGEEILMSARLFTHGYDLVTPDRNVITHHYERSEGPRFWDDLKGYRHKQLQSVQRVKQLLGIAAPDISSTDAYGMGTARSLDMFWKFSELDPVTKTTKSAARFCAESL